MRDKPPALLDLPCPTADEWREALRGRTPQHKWLELEAHFQTCPVCEATVDMLTELSDTCVRELCRGPCNADDEPVFQELYSRLLSSGELGSPTAMQEEVLALSLPFRLGNYELLSPLGQGANGSVFRARHVPLDREVVVKLLKPNQDFDPNSVERFVHEVRTVGQLNHPHIVRATDAGETDGQHFLVMEYVPGMDLSSVLEACGPLQIADVCEILRQAALGLACLHDNGFVHRDLKPSNLLLTGEGQTKLMDLGLVHYIGDGSAAADAHPKPPHGTADYMSPEQWQDFDRVDYRGDLYSLGCTLCKLLTGTPPFRPLPAGFATKSAAHGNAPIPKLSTRRSDVPDALQRIFERLMAKRPEDRYAHVHELIEQILPLTRGSDLPGLALQAGLPATAPAFRATQTWPFRPWTRREAVIAATLGACALIMGGSLMTRRIAHQPSSAFLETDVWRPLRPASTELLIGLDKANPASFSASHDAIQIRASRLAMLNLGQPVADAFRMAVNLKLPIGHYNAGVFFRYSEERRLGLPVQRCQTIELVQDPAGESGGKRSRLVWCALRIDAGDSPRVVRDLLADVEVECPEQAALLEVELSPDGYPSITWCGQPLPWDQWRTLSYEAREGAAAPRSRREHGFPGQIGLLAGSEDPWDATAGLQGCTEFRHPKLKYVTQQTVTEKRR